MRSAILLLAMVLVGCPGTPVCLCTAPELRLSWSEGGNFNSGVDGNVPLNAVTRGCSRKTRLRIDNVGLAAARLTLSTSSPSITLLGAPETLGVAEGQDFEVLASSSVDAELVIELEGQPTLHFQLQGAMVEPDPNMVHSLDFGGVAVGQTGRISTPPLVGIVADFVQLEGEVQFSPRTLGRQEVAASREAMLDCPDLSRVTIAGDGVPSVLSGPTELNFGDVGVGNAIELDVAVQNLGFDEVQVSLPGTDFTIVSSSATPSIATRDVRGGLVPGLRSQRIRFSPSVTGAITGQLEATAGVRRLVIPLRAVGVP